MSMENRWNNTDRDTRFFFLWHFDTIPGHGLPLPGFATTLIGHTTLGKTPLDESSARRRDLYLTIQETNIYPPGGIRTHYPSKRAAADPRRRQRG
jgi:hypothetical protein